MNISGNKYGYLTAVKQVRYDKDRRASIWLYRCDCGNEREIEARAVTAGRIRTCGKCELKHKLRLETLKSGGEIRPALRKLFASYIRNASASGKQWHLSIEDFRRMTTSRCSLCGTGPSLTLKGSRIPINKILLLDVNSHYTVVNCGTGCKQCSYLFAKVGISQALDRVVAIHKHLLGQ